MTQTEWLELMTPHAVRNLRDGTGFGVSAPKNRARVMWSFDGSYRAGQHRTGPATRYELGSRAWDAIVAENESSR